MARKGKNKPNKTRTGKTKGGVEYTEKRDNNGKVTKVTYHGKGKK